MDGPPDIFEDCEAVIDQVETGERWDPLDRLGMNIDEVGIVVDVESLQRV